jgi:hypothetical protein
MLSNTSQTDAHIFSTALGPIGIRGVIIQEEQSPGRYVVNGCFDRVAYIVLYGELQELDVSNCAERFEDGVGLTIRRESLAAGGRISVLVHRHECLHIKALVGEDLGAGVQGSEVDHEGRKTLWIGKVGALLLGAVWLYTPAHECLHCFEDVQVRSRTRQ